MGRITEGEKLQQSKNKKKEKKLWQISGSTIFPWQPNPRKLPVWPATYLTAPAPPLSPAQTFVLFTCSHCRLEPDRLIRWSSAHVFTQWLTCSCAQLSSYQAVHLFACSSPCLLVCLTIHYICFPSCSPSCLLTFQSYSLTQMFAFSPNNTFACLLTFLLFSYFPGSLLTCLLVHLITCSPVHLFI